MKMTTASARNARAYLHASAEEIRSAAAETQAEIDGMARLVTSLAEHVVGMSMQLDRLEHESLRPEDMKAMRDEVSSLDAVSNKTIARLQFAERLNRRLMAVQKNLDALAIVLKKEEEHIAPAVGARASKPRLTQAQHERLIQEIVVDGAANDVRSAPGETNVTWLTNDGWGKLNRN